MTRRSARRSARPPRGNRIRSKVAALLASLALLWGFAAYVTVNEGLNLLWFGTLYANLGQPVDNLVQALAHERTISVLTAATSDSSTQQTVQQLLYRDSGDRDPSPGETPGQNGSRDTYYLQTLDQARATTDTAAAALLTQAAKTSTRLAASDDTNAELADLRVALDGLAAGRDSVDVGRKGVSDTAAIFNTIIDAAFQLDRTLANPDNQGFATQTRALVNLVYARELLNREDALVVGLLTRPLPPTQAEKAEVAQLIGQRTYLHDLVVEELPTVGLADVLSSTRYAQFEQLEAEVSGATTAIQTATVTEWESATGLLLTQLRQVEVNGVTGAANAAIPLAVGTILRLLLLGILGLAAVIASIVVSITTARRLIRQLERLRNSARDLAATRLPRVVDRLQAGEQVDIDHEAPPLDFGRDEIGQVGQAFNAVQSTAVRVAVEQAELRRSVRDVFLSLARRSQALLHRQLTLLDAMERRTTDSEELAELFRIDHLATRMRRNAENLIVLSGASAGRSWRKPVPMVDVLRGALAEVEDYTRVTVLPVGNASLQGRAVGDVIHLLAELIENAVSFSPPQTVVRVGGARVGYGFAIEIEDRGLGMTETEREAANEQLLNPPEFRLTSNARLGLFVVGRLAERHGIKVRLTESAYGGTTAVVLLPGPLMAEESSEDIAAAEVRPEGGTRPSQLTDTAAASTGPGGGRHRHASDAAAVLDSANGHVTIATATVDDRPGGATTPVSPAMPPAVPPVLPAPRPPAPPLPTRPAPPPPAPAPAALPALNGADDEAPRITPSGLPWRQRRPVEAAPPVAPTPVGTGSATPSRPARGLDETRGMLSSYRAGTERGRADASRITDGEDIEAIPPTSVTENGE